MIDDALNMIQSELAQFVELNGGNASSVKLDNIAEMENNADALTDSIIISLVNIEEESALKNISTVRRNQLTGSMEHLHPPVFLNLYILFSSVMAASGAARYKNALNKLGLVIQFFQNRKIFTLNNSPSFSTDNSTELLKNLEKMKVHMDLYTLTFEQINHLWGSLGGKQVPFAMYKARLVEIKDEQVFKGTGVITEIQSRETVN
ncbi:MAG: DUF4255 domain-containing protein [Bacteroidota bacterium]